MHANENLKNDILTDLFVIRTWINSFIEQQNMNVE